MWNIFSHFISNLKINIICLLIVKSHKIYGLNIFGDVVVLLRYCLKHMCKFYISANICRYIYIFGPEKFNLISNKMHMVNSNNRWTNEFLSLIRTLKTILTIANRCRHHIFYYCQTTYRYLFQKNFKWYGVCECNLQ